MPKDIRQASLHRDIKILSGLLLGAKLREEANWLWMAFSSPASCDTQAAQIALRRAAGLARHHGFDAIGPMDRAGRHAIDSLAALALDAWFLGVHYKRK